MEEGEAAAIYFSRGSTAKKAGDEKTHDLYKHIREEEEHHREEFTKRYGELSRPQYSTTVRPHKYWVKIKDPGSSSFTKGSTISYEEFEAERERILERGEKPPSVEIVKEAPPDNGNGGKHLPATIEGEPVPEKYRELIPFVDAPLPLGSDFLTAVIPDDGERKIDVVMKQLQEGVEQIQGSEQFRLFLTTMSKFHDYSVSNLILILIQRPGATRVAGFTTWKNLGRWVKRGERGIAILAPVMPPKVRKEDEGEEEEVEIAPSPVYFKVVHVFDVSQTEGKPLPEFEVPVLTGEADEALFANVLELAKSQGVEVSFEPREYLDASIKGQYSAPKSIWVRPEESRAQQLKSLIHELAHYYSEGVFRIPRRDAETIAESAAFTVGAHYGFDSGVRSFPYVALWAQDKKILAQNLSSIRKVADTILHALGTAPKKFMNPELIPTEPTPQPIRDVSQWAKNMDMFPTEVKFETGIWRDSKWYGGIQGLIKVLKPGDLAFVRKVTLETTLFYSVENVNGKIEVIDRSFPTEEFEPALAYLPDSPEYLTQTIGASGWREQLDQAFEEAIARVRK